MEDDYIFKSLLLKVNNNNEYKYHDKIILYNWYVEQYKLLNEFLNTKNEITSDIDKIQLLYILYNKQLKEKNNIKKMKQKHNYFRKTLKKKIDN